MIYENQRKVKKEIRRSLKPDLYTYNLEVDDKFPFQLAPGTSLGTFKHLALMIFTYRSKVTILEFRHVLTLLTQHVLYLHVVITFTFLITFHESL